MNDQDRCGSRRDEPSRTLRVQQDGSSINVCKNRRCAGSEDPQDGRGCSERRRDDLIARSDSHRAKPQLDGIQPARNTNREWATGRRSPLVLERLDLRAENEPT